MRREHVTWLIIGVLGYYAFLRITGRIAGMPWAPHPVAAAA